MGHICKDENCTNPNIFGGGYCKYHQFRRSMRGGDKYQAKPKQNTALEARSPRKAYNIPKESKTRKEQGKTYKQVKDELRAELRSEGKYNCFFCTKPMGFELGFHHLKGRAGQNFIDKKYLVPGHNQCHVEDYHRSDVGKLLKFPWYQGFLARLKEIDESLYRTELKKQDKAFNFVEEDEE
jgi:hypothetical protein